MHWASAVVPGGWGVRGGGDGGERDRERERDIFVPLGLFLEDPRAFSKEPISFPSFHGLLMGLLPS